MTEPTTHLTKEDISEIIFYLDIIWHTEQEKGNRSRIEKMRQNKNARKEPVDN